MKQHKGSASVKRLMCFVIFPLSERDLRAEQLREAVARQGAGAALRVEAVRDLPAHKIRAPMRNIANLQTTSKAIDISEAFRTYCCCDESYSLLQFAQNLRECQPRTIRSHFDSRRLSRVPYFSCCFGSIRSVRIAGSPIFGRKVHFGAKCRT